MNSNVLTGGPDRQLGLSPTVLSYSRTSTEWKETELRRSLLLFELDEHVDFMDVSFPALAAGAAVFVEEESLNDGLLNFMKPSALEEGELGKEELKRGVVESSSKSKPTSCSEL